MLDPTLLGEARPEVASKNLHFIYIWYIFGDISHRYLFICTIFCDLYSILLDSTWLGEARPEVPPINVPLYLSMLYLWKNSFYTILYDLYSIMLDPTWLGEARPEVPPINVPSIYLWYIFGDILSIYYSL